MNGIFKVLGASAIAYGTVLCAEAINEIAADIQTEE